MGKTSRSGLGTGVGSSSQTSISQNNLNNKINELIEREEILKPLIDAGVKFNADDVLFVANDKTGQLIWLEKGNDGAGLSHILNKHAEDFALKHKVSKENISSHIKNIINNGNVEYSRITKRAHREGIEKLYSHNGTYYLLTGIGTNGFIVSAYHVSEKEATRLKERYKK